MRIASSTYLSPTAVSTTVTPGVLHRQPEPEVGHDRRDHRVAPAGRWPCSPSASTARIWSPSTTWPVSVDRQASVRVTIVRDASVGPLLDDGCPQHVQMGRAAAVVDVLAVGLGADRDHVRARAPQQRPGPPRMRRRARSPPPPAESGAGWADRGSARPHRGRAARPAGEVRYTRSRESPSSLTRPKPAAWRPGHGLARAGQPRLDLVFGGVGKLEPAPGEQLDPVVRGRIVAGRQHDPEVRRTCRR